MNISAIEKGRRKSWNISLGESIDATSADSSTFSLSREGIARKMSILDGLIFRRTIAFKKPINKVLQMDPLSFNVFARWLGYQPMLEIFLKNRFGWTVAIGVLFIISSMPLPGDAASGINPVPFNPLNMGMGMSLILIGIFSKKFPDRMYFLVDSFWFIILAIITFLGILNKGSSIFWLIFVVFQIVLAASGFLIWNRLKVFENEQTK
jgi:hypothetical protein